MLYFTFIIISSVSVQGAQSLSYNDFSNNVRHGSCRFRSVRQAELHWNSPGQSMTESFVLDDVEYKLCKYHVTWDEALVFCSSHKAHLATLDNEEKTTFVIQAIASSSSVSEDYWIGARKLYDDPWAWNSNEMRLSSEKDIISNIRISYPGFVSNVIHCLTIDRSRHDEPIFIPRACNQRRGFICQRDNDRAFDNKIRMVAASRIGEQEFRLYAGRATWAEAVVQCRQEGLQIGEVNTVEEARALAISMLRNRPEGIENAWIGGYTRNDDPSTWRWLASGEKIENNDMWRKNLSESLGGCLLLDRHVCESPVYVESTCDRKRDVLCQKPPKKRPSKTPVSIFVDGCPYWIGLYPLKWSDARISCESLNASLVVLDSSATISHMMSIMLDNKAEMRHIWTDGRRSNTKGHWEWAATGEPISDFGKSFIPWCPEDYHTNESGCLNLDRENLDSPIVYGLSCREKQTYVCQPRTGDCVFHSTSKLALDTVNDASENVQKRTTFKSPLIFYKSMATLPMSTVTTPYPMTNDNYAVIQTSLEGGNGRLDDLIHWKPADNDSEKNYSSGQNFAQYLKPFSHFTLPSLPQFGIKVVSAAETTTNPISFDNKKKKSKAYKILTTSSYASTATVLPPSSLFPTTVKKSSSDARKASKLPLEFTNPSATSILSDLHEVTISSISIGNTYETSSKIVNSSRPAFTKISSGLKSFLGSKNASKTSKTFKMPTTLSSIPSDNLSSDSSTSDFGRTRKYSIKTTRDLNSSNDKSIASVTTSEAPDIPNVTDRTNIKSDSKELRQNLPPKPVIDPLQTQSVRPNATFIIRRKNIPRFTTEATTPYDAIDADYYNDYKDDKSVKKTSKEDSKPNRDSNEYSDDYDSTTSAKLQTKKKPKQRLNSSLRKNFNRKKIQEEEKEEEEEEEEEGEEDEVTTETSIPLAEELSKNLKNTLVNIMKKGIERKKSEKEATSLRRTQNESQSEKVENAQRIKEEMDNIDIERRMETSKLETFTMRPYYAFEGPMIVAFRSNTNAGGNTLKAKNSDSDNGREVVFIGKRLNEESYSDDGKVSARNLLNNETRRMKTEHPNHRNPTNHIPISMSGMPPIQPNDPNSLMQLGRFFKNKFEGYAQNSERVGEGRRPLTTNTRVEMERSDHRRNGQQGRSHSRLRGGYPMNRDEAFRRKGQRWGKSRRPQAQESETNYYDGSRRLYPRGNYDIDSSLVQQGERRNEGRLREEQERLDAVSPYKNMSYYENFGELSQAVSPRSSPIPIRTTRSFHEETGAQKIDAAKPSILPDLKFSKLVKEVKIDLDQRMLRKYLEGFATKITRKNPDAKDDDWKDTWKQLLRQMLSVLDRMNINVNGDVMKLRASSDDRENKLSVSLGNLRELGWNSGQRKQRKDLVDINRNDSNQSKKANERSQKNSEEEHHLAKSIKDRQASAKSSQKMNSKIQIKSETTDSYKLIYDNRTLLATSSLQDKIKGTTLPRRDNNYKNFGDKSSANYRERIDTPAIDPQGISRRMPNLFQTKYTNFSNLQMIRAPQSIVPVARLSTVFGYRPLMPQLHHRIIFQPGWGPIQPSPMPHKAVFNSKYLPKGALSRIVGREYKNKYFGGKIDDASKSEYLYLDSTSSTAKPVTNQLENSLKNSLDKNINERLENQRKMDEKNPNFYSGFTLASEISFVNNSRGKEQHKSNENDAKHYDKVFGTVNNMNGAWRDVATEIGMNKLRNEDLSEYYNVSYVDKSNDRKIDDNNEEKRRVMYEEIVDDEANPTENNELKSIWSPAHRLTKALELSVLRKFGINPSNSLQSKNMVTRSLKEIQATHGIDALQSANRNSGYYRGQNLENLNDEPSIVSLRMIMDPEKKSSRILRQSQNSQIPGVKPQTIEVRVQFSGKEEPRKAIKEQIYSQNYLIQNKIENQTLHDSAMNNQSLRRDSVLPDLNTNTKKSFNSIIAKKRPIRFFDTGRRRAITNRLRKRSRNLKKNYLPSYDMHRENKTTMSSDPRDRKSRNIGLGRKNMLSDVKASNETPKVKHYIATSLRSFDERNLTNREQSKWKKGKKSYGKDLGIDWAEQASALFTDLKESSDDLTLYIDLTFGRVGSKPRNGGRSRG